jgi:hypothetical protein
MHGIIKPAPSFKIDADLVWSFVPPGVCSLVGDDSIMSGASGAGGGYVIENSALFDGSTGYFNRTPSSDGSLRSWTLSCWVKRSRYCDNNDGMSIMSVDNAKTDAGRMYFQWVDFGTPIEHLRLSGHATEYVGSSAAYRDFAAWQHLVITADTDNATGDDRFIMYVNGVRLALGVNNNPSINFNTPWNDASFVHRFGAGYNITGAAVSNFLDGYIAEAVFIDGQSLTPTSFGEFNDDGFWVPKSPAGLTFGDEGFWLDFAASGDLGNDVSGNNNDWTKNGTITQVQDTPSDKSANGTANYATWNPLDYGTRTTSATFSNGNKTVANSGASGDSMLRGSMGFDAGVDHVYFEMETTSGASLPAYIGIMTGECSFDKSANPYTNGTLENFGYRSSTGNLLTDSAGEAGAAYGDTWTDADHVGVRVDAGSLYFYKNGTIQNSGTAAATGLTGRWYPMFIGGGGTWNMTAHFADAELQETIPSGAVTLSTDNVTRNQTGVLGDHFATNLRTGTGAEAATTGIGFQPDMVFGRARDNGTDWYWCDALQGATYWLESNKTTASQTDAQTLKSFDSDGFTMGTNTSFNNNTTTYVDYCIKAASTASGATTGLGTAKTYSTQYNPDLGFAIIKYTGNGTAAHTIPLPTMTDPKAPFFTVHKKTSAAADWTCWHEGLSGPTKFLKLSTTESEQTAATMWNSTAPTSSVITLGTHSNVNANAVTYIIYVFWETDFCKPVNFTSNANADGAFQNLGGAVEFALWKRSAAVAAWYISDKARSPYNPSSLWLKPNDTAAEGSGSDLYDFVSNGLKVRLAGGDIGAADLKIGFAFVEPEPDSTDGAQVRAK